MRWSALLLLALISIQCIGCKQTEIPASQNTRIPFPATRPGEVLDISLAELGNFDFDPDAKDPPIPDDVEALNGVVIRLRGYMVPLDSTDDIKRFALVPHQMIDDQRPPDIQQTILVTCPKDKSVKYYPDEIVVQGKLTVGIVKDEGLIVNIFAVDNADVKPASK